MLIFSFSQRTLPHEVLPCLLAPVAARGIEKHYR